MAVRIVPVVLISMAIAGLVLVGFYFGLTQASDLQLIYQPASECGPQGLPPPPTI